MKKLLFLFLILFVQEIFCEAIILQNKNNSFVTDTFIEFIIYFKNQDIKIFKLKYDEEISFDVKKLNGLYSIKFDDLEIDDVCLRRVNSYGSRYMDLRLNRAFFERAFSKLEIENQKIQNFLIESNAKLILLNSSKFFYIMILRNQVDCIEEELSELEQAYMRNCVIL